MRPFIRKLVNFNALANCLKNSEKDRAIPMTAPADFTGLVTGSIDGWGRCRADSLGRAASNR